jgi:hypothetical protein
VSPVIPAAAASSACDSPAQREAFADFWRTIVSDLRGVWRLARSCARRFGPMTRGYRRR